MQKGEEPLRSFGDLMQFFDKPPAVEDQQPEKPAEESKPKQVDASDNQEDAAMPASSSAEVGQGGLEASSTETGSALVASESDEAASKSKDQDGPDSPSADSSPAADTPTS